MCSWDLKNASSPCFSFVQLWPFSLALVLSYIQPVYTSLAILPQWWWWQRRGRENKDRGCCGGRKHSSVMGDCTNLHLVIATLCPVCKQNKNNFSLYIILDLRKRVCAVWTLLGKKKHVFFFTMNKFLSLWQILCSIFKHNHFIPTQQPRILLYVNLLSLQLSHTDTRYVHNNVA